MDGLVSVSQHGFRKNHSTDTAICELISTVVTSLESKNVVGIYSADLTAAFDLLRKEILVETLIKREVPGYLIKIIHNYLSGRTGYVQIEESRSCDRDILTGCVQGSILGPVLFNIYMSELEDVVAPCKLISYADDSYIVIEAENKEILKNLTTLTMTRHFEWLRSKGMLCNMSKTKLLIIGSENMTVRVGNDMIESKPSMKVLGVHLDNNLRWDCHVEKLVTKCRSFTFTLRYIRRYLNNEEMSRVIKAHIISRIAYASPSWSNFLRYNLKNKIKSVFFHILRVAQRDFNFVLNRASLLSRMNMESIETIFFKRTSVFIFNTIFHMAPTSTFLRLISKSYQNERMPNRLVFFDTSSARVSKICISNVAHTIVARWNFDWLNKTPSSFKMILKESTF